MLRYDSIHEFTEFDARSFDLRAFVRISINGFASFMFTRLGRNAEKEGLTRPDYGFRLVQCGDTCYITNTVEKCETGEMCECTNGIGCPKRTNETEIVQNQNSSSKN